MFFFHHLAYSKFVLSEKKGAAFLTLPGSGTLQPFEEQIIEVIGHSDMWGTYYDNLIFKVRMLYFWCGLVVSYSYSF